MYGNQYHDTELIGWYHEFGGKCYWLGRSKWPEHLRCRVAIIVFELDTHLAAFEVVQCQSLARTLPALMQAGQQLGRTLPFHGGWFNQRTVPEHIPEQSARPQRLGDVATQGWHRRGRRMQAAAFD